MRERSRHHLHRHRLGTRPLERHHAQGLDHDRLSYNRRTDREYREVKRSYLSVLLSGTPAQVKPLIPTAENGLFSRQLFYYMPAIHKCRTSSTGRIPTSKPYSPAWACSGASN